MPPIESLLDPSAASASPSTPSASPRLTGTRGAMLASIALLVVGIAMRLRFYFDRRSLWLDEVWVALNIVGRGFLGLATPLDYRQTAPVGFLWAERLAVRVGGMNELALRALPLLAGCLLLYALWMLARRLLDVRYAALCLAFAALSPLLLYYSNEAKPYILDALVAVVLTWLALDVLDAPNAPRAWWRLLIGGVLGILFSTPSAFVLAGIGIALIAHRAIGGTRIGWARVAGVAVVWVALFALGYFTLYRGVANSGYMQSSWEETFLAFPLGTLARRANTTSRMMWINTLFGETEAMLLPKTLACVALLSAGGAVVLWRRRGLQATLLVVLPIVVAAGASFARLWPLTPRVLLFLAPALLLLLGAGIWGLARLLPARMQALALVLLGGLLLVPASVNGARALRVPKRNDDAAPLIREFLASPKSGTLMYLLGHASPSWQFYTVPWTAREGEGYAFAMSRGKAEVRSRGCITQQPGLRVVFGPMGPDMHTDSALAAESAWLAAQPEREIWVLALSYEHADGHLMERLLAARGAVRVEERSRNGAELRHFRLPAPVAPSAAVSCDTQLVPPPASGTTPAH